MRENFNFSPNPGDHENMALAMKHLQNVKQKEWIDLFASISNTADSFLFIKFLTNLVLPTILLMRKILPESEFEGVVFEGMTLKVLKTNTRNLDTGIIQTWLAGANDALEKKYVKTISLEVKDAKSDLSLEIYTINIMSNNASISVSTLSGQGENISFREQVRNIQLQTVRLLQMCFSVTKSCLDLPPEVTLMMKLSYHSNVPSDYHPFGYKAYTPTMPIFLKKTRSFEIGVVNTKHHIIELMNKTCLCDETILPKAKTNMNTEDVYGGTESPCYFSKGKQGVPKQPDKPIVNLGQNTPLSTPTIISDESNREISSQFTDYSQSDFVRCPCLSKMKTSVMYQCSGCRYWDCFGIRLKKILNSINIFYCQICDKMNEDYVCPDELMMKLDRATDQQKLAVKRRLLIFCNRFKGQKVTFRTLEKVSGLSCHRILLENIIKDLVNMGALIQQAGKYQVIKNKVVQFLPQFFTTGSTSSPVPSHATGQMPAQLGKRKLERTEEPHSKVFRTPRVWKSRFRRY